MAWWRSRNRAEIADNEPEALDAGAILRRARRLRFRVRPETAQELAGAYHRARPGIGLMFSELRAYEPGDDVRYLDWNVTARQGRPYVRRFVEERALTLWLVVDVSASMRFGAPAQTKADRAAQAAALLAAAAIQSGDRVGLMLVTDAIEFELRPSGGFRHLSRVLRALIATPTGSARTRLEVILPSMRRAARRSLYLVLSDFERVEPATVWRAAAARHDVVAARLVDRLELELPNVGVLSLEDPETRARRMIDTGSSTVRQLYAARARAATEAFSKWCGDASIDGLVIPTADEPIGPLLHFLRTRARVRRPARRR